MRQLLGALFGCGWTVDDVSDLSFDQIREVARCVYAHKQQMINSVLEPIADGLNKGTRKGRKGRAGGSRGASPKTQQSLRNTGLSPSERDNILMGRLRDMGFKT